MTSTYSGAWISHESSWQMIDLQALGSLDTVNTDDLICWIHKEKVFSVYVGRSSLSLPLYSKHRAPRGEGERKGDRDMSES